MMNTNHKIADHNCCQEEGNTGHVSHQHTIPHTLDPLSAQYAEHNHETVHEVRKVPPRKVTVGESIDVI